MTSSNLHALLRQLQERNIQLWLDDGQLRFKAPNGAFSPELKSEVKQQKENIIAWLREHAEFKQERKEQVVIPVAEVNPEEGYRLSFSQQRLWFLQQYEPDSTSYHCPFMVPLGELNDQAKIEACFADILRKHASLRTCFNLVNEEPKQFIRDDVVLNIPHVDCEGYTSVELQNAVDTFLAQPFDLSLPPLVRAIILRLNADTHYLLVCMHHILTDGWSMNVLRKDLLRGLNGDAIEKANEASEPLRYADYAHWQAEHLNNEVLPKSLPYWQELLDSAPTESELPVDLPRAQVRSNNGCFFKQELDGSLVEKIRQFLPSKGVTLYMLGLCAYSIVLARMSRQQDLLIGTPVANRSQEQLADIVGFFVNTLVARCQVQWDVKVEDYLSEIRDQCLAGYEHQAVPFELLVEKLNIPRDQSRTPLVQTMFAVQNANAGEDLIHEGEGQQPFQIDSVGTKFDINISLIETQNGIHFECEYNADLYWHSTIENLFHAFCQITSRIIGQPQATLSQLPMLSQIQSEQVLKTSRGVDQEYSSLLTVSQAFDACVKQFPERIALDFDGSVLTYHQLNVCIENLACQLLNEGMSEGQVVPILMDRSLDMVIAIYAILRAGGAYLPIDTSMPSSRVEFILQDSGSNLVIVSRHLRDSLQTFSEAHSLFVVESGGDSFVTSELCDSNYLPALDQQNIDSAAYVIYTSGSTGNPKGVVNTHKALYNRIAWMHKNHEIGEFDAVLQKTNYAFDVSVWEFIWPLTYGAKLVIAEPEGHKVPSYLVNKIQSSAITVVHFVPSMFRLFLEEEGVAQLESLNAVFCSGEALPKELVELFYSKQLPCKLFNLYGPTEAAIDVTYWDCASPAVSKNSVPIGYPIDNTAIYILDETLNLVPQGVPGEIYIGGMGLASGYFRRPDLTANAFIADPFADTDSARMYKTGDLGRYLSDGSIEYLGRIDFQVKIRGQRIEIEEIEKQCGLVGGVQSVAVVVAKSKANEDHLVAYYVGSATVDDLRKHLSVALSQYMIPTFFVQLDEMPLNRTGKLDRKVLVAKGLPQIAPVADEVAGSTSEKKIQEIWRTVLNLDSVGVEQNFFEIGGTSLLMVKVHRQIKAEFEIDISMVKLFSFPTIRGLAAYIDGNNDTNQTIEKSVDSIKTGNKRLNALRNRRKNLVNS